MHTALALRCRSLFLPLLIAVTASPAQTVPHWSTYFGGSGHDMGAAVRLGPNGLVYVCGTTLSNNLPTTSGVVQPAYGGSGDAFLACFDPALPPTQQLQWCSYYGGSGIDIGLDLVVDGQGNVTIVGLTASGDLPMGASVPGFQGVLAGPSDGFVATFAANGTTLLYATYYGGSGHDRCGAIAADGAGGFLVVGVTESTTGLPGTANGWFPSPRGGVTDAFVAHLIPSGAAQVPWATYLGGPGFDGEPYASLAAWGGLTTAWEVALRSHAVAVDVVSGAFVVGTSSYGVGPGNTTANALQATNPGGRAFYVVHGVPAGSGYTLAYGSYVGGSGTEDLYGIAFHPAGGFVVCGETTSSNMPVTTNALQPIHRGGPSWWPSDGYLCWLDPAQGAGMAQLRYGTYCGSGSGNEGFVGVAVDDQGLVTLTGDGFGGVPLPYPTTEYSLQSVGAPGARCGALVRIRMAGQNAADLVYGTLFGDVWNIHSRVVLDDFGDAFVVGASISTAYPTTANAYQPLIAGPRDLVVSHLPLLAGGTHRRDTGWASWPCGSRLFAATMGAPVRGNLAFELAAHGAPPSSFGTVAFGWGPPPLPVQALGMSWLIDAPVPGLTLQADGLGFAHHPLPLQLALPALPPIHAQWVFLTTAACPGFGLLAGCERLEFQVW